MVKKFTKLQKAHSESTLFSVEWVIFFVIALKMCNMKTILRVSKSCTKSAYNSNTSSKHRRAYVLAVSWYFLWNWKLETRKRALYAHAFQRPTESVASRKFVKCNTQSWARLKRLPGLLADLKATHVYGLAFSNGLQWMTVEVTATTRNVSIAMPVIDLQLIPVSEPNRLYLLLCLVRNERNRLYLSELAYNQCS